jgi:hypothetical protein
MTPKRIRRERAKGWKMPPNTVYVGRPTKWGNPFNGEDAVERYRACVSEFPVSQERFYDWKANGGNPLMLMCLAGNVRSVLDELRGKDLACWCALDKPCHADVLLEIVNEGEVL